MFRQTLRFINSTLLVASLALALPVQAQKPVPPTPTVEITNISLYSQYSQGQPCNPTLEKDCIYVVWKVNNAPADKSGFSFVLSGKLNYESGSSANISKTIESGNALSSLLDFIHSGSGATKSAEVTLKLFKRDGFQKILLSQTTQTKTF